MVKAVRFSAAGEPEAVAAVRAVVDRPRPGWAEQDMTAVWAAVAQVTVQVAPADGDVELVAVTAQGDGCWLVDADGQPVRPALLWSDARSAATVAAWQAAGLLDEAFAVTGSYGNSGLAHAELAWLAEHEPRTVERAASLLSCGSWVYLQLTGRRALEVSDACNPLLDATTGAYAVPLLQHLGVGWAERLLPEVVSGSAAVGALLPDPAERLGLAAGMPVVLGPYDVVASALGVGAVAAGQGFAVLGTTLCVGAVTTDPVLDRVPSGMALTTGWPQRWLLAYATLSGTEVLEWARRLLGVGSAADLVALAATARRGAPAPLVLPYLSPAGERAPFLDASARGAVLGLSEHHEPADLARGVLEGLSLAVRDCLVASGQQPSTLAVCGGGARSDGWCQLLADVTGTVVTRTDQDQVGARGAVLSGSVATGRYPTVDAAAATVTAGRSFAPSSDGGRYDALYERYLAARELGVARV